MTKIENKVGFIGVGNMGSSILQGVLEKGIAESKRLCVFDKLESKAKEFASKWSVIQAPTCEELVNLCDVIIIAVKPQDFSELASEIKAAMKEKKVVISILAGMTCYRMQEALGDNAVVVRSMPNLGARVGQSMTALTSKDSAALAVAEQIFLGCGQTARINEDQFDLVTAISGSGPAYFFYLMERLAAEAERKGMSKKDAVLFATQTALGSALLATSSPESPAELRKMVTSKGGTTEAAIQALQAKDFEKMVEDAINAAQQRGQELSQS